MRSVESRLEKLERQEVASGTMEVWLDIGDGRFREADGLVLTRDELDARPTRPGVRTLRVVIARRADGR